MPQPEPTAHTQAQTDSELSKQRFAMVLKESSSSGGDDPNSINSDRQGRLRSKEKNEKGLKNGQRLAQPSRDKENQRDNKREAKPTTVEGYQRTCLQIDRERQELMEEEQLLLSLDRRLPPPSSHPPKQKHARASSQAKQLTRNSSQSKKLTASNSSKH